MTTSSPSQCACPETNFFLEAAQSRTGLDDFGDPAFRVPLDVFVEALRSEIWDGMTDGARLEVVEYIVSHLCTRLQVVADRRAYPGIAREEIRQPIIVVSPPRSGSTLLHTLLSLDPESKAPEHWQCVEPSPPPALAQPSLERLDKAQAYLMDRFNAIPDMLTAHPYLIEEGAGALAECGSDILSMMFTNQQQFCAYGGESYRQYLLEADHTAALDFHHDFLQHLQFGTVGGHWALKGADHLLWLGELAARYPDANFVWTHRSLSTQLSSLASIYVIVRGLTGHIASGEERIAIARTAIEHQAATFLKAMKVRDALGQERFCDVSYRAIMADPVAEIGRVYSHFGLAMSETHAQNIRQWVRDNPPTKHGEHRHSLDSFGFEVAELEPLFRDYIDRFGCGFDRPALASPVQGT